MYVMMCEKKKRIIGYEFNLTRPANYDFLCMYKIDPRNK